MKNNLAYYNFITENYSLVKKNGNHEMYVNDNLYRVFRVEYTTKPYGTLEYQTNAVMIYSGKSRDEAEVFLD